MVRALTFGETHIHGKNAQNPGKYVFDGLELPGPSPAWFQDYPRNSGFQGPGIAVPAGLGIGLGSGFQGTLEPLE